ncbi:hypothetical protein A4X06_0g5559 [Tilletia controversa]|uniref:Uncharacterized protein n=1 Tax=Tilletia controversa TaxID=13291 RepID=A0A8X7MQG0_9BASI|nr:hypothetical protein A4X06_0g5559 [Tilletia controversa]
MVDPMATIQSLSTMRDETDILHLTANVADHSLEVPMTPMAPITLNLVVLPIAMEGASAIKMVVIPYGATIQEWWDNSKSTPAAPEPTILLDGVLVRGNPMFGTLLLDRDTSSRL